MSPDVIKIQSHTGIAAAVPYLLGFHPTESLVLIGLEQARLAFTMRMDLQPGDLDAAVVADTVRRMSGYSQVIVAVYTDELSEGDHPRRTLVDQLTAVLDVREALLIRGDRVWSYLCSDPNCCPDTGLTYSESTDADAVAAAHVLRGRRPLGSRDQLLATVTEGDRDTASAVERVLPEARAAAAVLAHEGRTAALSRLLAATLARLDDPRAQLSVEEVAAYVALLDDVRVRDVFIHRLAATDDPAARTLLDRLVAAAPGGADAEVCAAKSFLAYLDGDGVSAKAAAERALRSQPGHRLCEMLQTAVEASVSPSQLRRQISTYPL